MDRFFGKFKECNTEIYIFDSEIARDAWVNFNDVFSKTMGTTPENAFFRRQAISENKALALAGNAIDNKNNYFIDAINECVVVCFSPKVTKAVLESHRAKIIADKFGELKEASNNL